MNDKGTFMSAPEVIDLENSSDSEIAVRRPARNGSYFDRFLVYIDSVRQLRKLRLLDGFVQSCWQDFGESCVLQTPDGKSFTIQLMKYRMRYYLTEGWETFCRGYGIDRGSSIVFQYIGDTIFDLIVFGFSDNEIKYYYAPSATIPTTLATYTVEGQSNPAAPPSKRVRKFLDRKSKHCPISDPVCNNGLNNSRCPTKLSGQCSGKDVVSKTHILAIGIEKRLKKRVQTPGVDQKNRGSSSRTPSFKAVLTEACLGKNDQLWIPKAHSTSYMKNFAESFVTLQSGTNMFFVTVCRGGKGMRFGHGWIGFAEACGFVVGCEYLFELVDVRAQTYNVRRV